MSDSIGKNIGEFLYQKRKSQSWLANQCGVTKSHINQIIKGKANPSLKLITNISNSLGVEISEIIENKGNK